MNGTYNITLKSQLGPKSGTLFLKATRRRLWCCLNILGHENILVGIHDKNTFSLKGNFSTALGPAKCQLLGRLIGPYNFDNLGEQTRDIIVGGAEDATINTDLGESPGETLAEGLAETREEGLAEGLAETREEGLAEPLAESRAETLGEGLAEGLAEPLAETRAETREEGLAEPLGESLIEGNIIIDGKEYAISGAFVK